jgi:hypothetical protein
MYPMPINEAQQLVAERRASYGPLPAGLKRLLIGNTAERVLDHLSCDVLLVKPSVAAGKATPKGATVEAMAPSAPRT